MELIQEFVKRHLNRGIPPMPGNPGQPGQP